MNVFDTQVRFVYFLNCRYTYRSTRSYAKLGVFMRVPVNYIGIDLFCTAALINMQKRRELIGQVAILRLVEIMVDDWLTPFDSKVYYFSVQLY